MWIRYGYRRVTQTHTTYIYTNTSALTLKVLFVKKDLQSYTDIYTFQLLYIDRYSIRLAIFESSQSAHIYTYVQDCMILIYFKI